MPRFCASAALATTALSATVVGVATATTMVCGEGVKLCGVLTLESGLGPGAYEHDAVTCHGLWPETGSYGTSACLAPGDKADPDVIYPCYAGSGGDVVSFEVHEWEKHGECAGVADEADYFDQVCALAQTPVAIMTSVRTRGGDLDAMASAVAAAGYEIFEVDAANGQLLLSACAGPDTRWTLAAEADFAATCGGWADDDDDDDDDVAPSQPEACRPNEHGPPCATDEACAGVADCVRCAHSGFCTDVPLSSTAVY